MVELKLVMLKYLNLLVTIVKCIIVMRGVRFHVNFQCGVLLSPARRLSSTESFVAVASCCTLANLWIGVVLLLADAFQASTELIVRKYMASSDVT